MRKFSWQLTFGILLVLLSAALYLLHYSVFHDWHHIGIYMLGDIAFVPLEVLLATLIIHAVLKRRERQSLHSKLNMVIGVYFGDGGADLLKHLSRFTSKQTQINEIMNIRTQWTAQNFKAAISRIKALDFQMDKDGDIEALARFLGSRRDFILRLLENPNLLEHESFTDVLWAVTHLAEELNIRDNLKTLPDTDRAHINGDMKRAYGQMLTTWLAYMQHLKNDYPYLLSLAVRTNPFNPNASPTVT